MSGQTRQTRVRDEDTMESARDGVSERDSNDNAVEHERDRRATESAKVARAKEPMNESGRESKRDRERESARGGAGERERVTTRE